MKSKKDDKIALEPAETREKDKASAPADKGDKGKAKKGGDKKPNIFRRMGRKIKEVFSELKKVTWPTFGKAVRQTCVVLVVVLIFLVVLMGIDYGLGALLKLITSLAAK